MFINKKIIFDHNGEFPMRIADGPKNQGIFPPKQKVILRFVFVRQKP